MQGVIGTALLPLMMTMMMIVIVLNLLLDVASVVIVFTAYQAFGVSVFLLLRLIITSLHGSYCFKSQSHNCNHFPILYNIQITLAYYLPLQPLTFTNHNKSSKVIIRLISVEKAHSCKPPHSNVSITAHNLRPLNRHLSAVTCHPPHGLSFNQYCTGHTFTKLNTRSCVRLLITFHSFKC